MKIATWNVNGIRARHEELRAWVERDRPDIVCLQEIKARPEQVPDTVCELPDFWCYWHGSGGYSGVSLQIRRAAFPGPPRFTHPSFDNETRIVQADCGKYVFACVYVPNGGKDFDAKMTFMNAMTPWIASFAAEGKELVLCGDMNVALTDRDVHPKERKPNAIGQRPEERELIQAWIAAGVVDVGRTLDPENDGLFTWWPYWRNMRQKNIGWRLDYVFAAPALAARATSCRVLTEIGTSDHAPVMAEFVL